MMDHALQPPKRSFAASLTLTPGSKPGSAMDHFSMSHSILKALGDRNAERSSSLGVPVTDSVRRTVRHVESVPILLVEDVENAGLNPESVQLLRFPPGSEINNTITRRFEASVADLISGACHRNGYITTPIFGCVAKANDGPQRRYRVDIL